MRPVNATDAAPANIISIETLKKASEPEKQISSIAVDIFNGIETLSKNPVVAPLFTAGAQALQAYAVNLMQKGTKQQNTSENDGKVLFE